METLIFVYGTLRLGEWNHRLLASAESRGAARAPGFLLHDLGGCPAAVPCASNVRHSSVAGEVYAVDAPTLARVDRLEGHPDAWRRVPVTLENGTVAWIYTMRPDQVSWARLIPGGDWTDRAEPLDTRRPLNV